MCVKCEGAGAPLNSVVRDKCWFLALCVLYSKECNVFILEFWGTTGNSKKIKRSSDQTLWIKR